MCHQISLRDIIITTKLVFTASHKRPLLEAWAKGLLSDLSSVALNQLVGLAYIDRVNYVTDDIFLCQRH